MSSARTADELQRLKADLASSQRRHTSLLRETSELKEQLRVESKRRETAAKKCSESQTALRDCEREIKELQFTNKKITQQLQKTSEQAQDQATRSRYKQCLIYNIMYINKYVCSINVPGCTCFLFVLFWSEKSSNFHQIFFD